MRIKKGKIIIRKEDLTRKVVIIANHTSEIELQTAQYSAMEAKLGCLAIPTSSFEAYNRFRVKNKMKPLTFKDCLVMDLFKINEEKKKQDEAEHKLHPNEGVQSEG